MSQLWINRAAVQDRFSRVKIAGDLYFQLGENVANEMVRESVDNDTYRPVFIMTAHQYHGLGEIGILHLGHGHQKLVGQVS